MVKLKCKNEYFRIRGVFVKINLKLVAIILSLALILSSALVFSGCEGEIIAENFKPYISSNISSENTTSKTTPSNSSTLPSATTKPSSTVSVEKPKVENDNSPGTIWESKSKHIIIEYNYNKKHKCYIYKTSEPDILYFKIDKNQNLIFYNSKEMLDSQKIDTEQWQVVSKSFNEEKNTIQTKKSDYFANMKKIALYNKGRNPVNDPDISVKLAEKTAIEEFEQNNFNFVTFEYEGIEYDKNVKCYSFVAREEELNIYHIPSAWVRINTKTGEVHSYSECC